MSNGFEHVWHQEMGQALQALTCLLPQLSEQYFLPCLRIGEAHHSQLSVEPLMGIEPMLAAYHAAVIPLHYKGKTQTRPTWDPRIERVVWGLTETQPWRVGVEPESAVGGRAGSRTPRFRLQGGAAFSRTSPLGYRVVGPVERPTRFLSRTVDLMGNAPTCNRVRFCADVFVTSPLPV